MSALPDLGSVNDGGMSEDDAAAKLAAIPDDLEDEAPAQSAEQQTEADQPEDKAPVDDENDAAEDEAAKPTEQAGESDEDLVELADGTKKPLTEILDVYANYEERVKGFQRESTARFEEAARLREEANQEAEKVLKWAEDTRAINESILALREQFVGKRPTAALAAEDPLQYQIDEAQWRERNDAFENHVATFNNNRVQEHRALQEREAQQRHAEWTATLEKFPELREKKNQDELLETMETTYGIPRDALVGVTNASHISVMMDAMKYRQTLKAAEGVKASVGQKPRVIRGGKTQAGRTIDNGAELRRKALRETGSLSAAIEALKDFGD